jgi:hypothetical protein
LIKVKTQANETAPHKQRDWGGKDLRLRGQLLPAEDLGQMWVFTNALTNCDLRGDKVSQRILQEAGRSQCQGHAKSHRPSGKF